MGGPNPTPAGVEALRREHAAREEQERQRRQNEQDRAVMAGIPGASLEQEPDHPPQGGSIPERTGDTKGLPTVDKRSRLETILAPLAIAVLGFAMIVAAFGVYPKTSEVLAPPFSTLDVTASFPIASVNYLVRSQSPGTVWIRILVDLPNGMAHPPAQAPAAGLAMSLPPGASFLHCPKPRCTGSIGGQPLAFNSMSGSAGQATVIFLVKATDFGVTSNGTTAAAAIPAIFWNVPGPGLFYAAYGVRSATAYDWAPAARGNSGTAVWTEPVTKGYMAGVAATGVNHSAQSAENFKLFLAGALIALGGGAILAAIIEAVHRRDWDTIRALRSK